MAAVSVTARPPGVVGKRQPRASLRTYPAQPPRLHGGRPTVQGAKAALCRGRAAAALCVSWAVGIRKRVPVVTGAA